MRPHEIGIDSAWPWPYRGASAFYVALDQAEPFEAGAAPFSDDDVVVDHKPEATICRIKLVRRAEEIANPTLKAESAELMPASPVWVRYTVRAGKLSHSGAEVANLLNPRSSWLRNLVGQLMCETREIFDFAAHHPMREMRKLALAETVAYIRENMSTAIGAYTKRQFLDIALKRVNIDGHYVEFGVYTGESIGFIASRVSGKDIVGFDSFEGLPEDWPGREIKGTFSLEGKLPKVPHNVKLQPGWFDLSLPRWLEANPGPMAFIHIDCDLYASAKTVFDLIASRIVPGTVIAFDEYFNYPHWQHHEFKAFQEYVRENKVGYQYLAYGATQAAVRITDGLGQRGAS